VGEILSSKDIKIDPKDVTRELICAWHKKACVNEFNILNCDLNQTIKVLTQLLLERWNVNE
jgi:hypothetical protein